MCQNTHRVTRGMTSSFDLKICTYSMLTLCGSVSLQLFLIYVGLLLPLSNLFVVRTTRSEWKLWKLYDDKCTDFFYLEKTNNIVWTFPAYAYAQNCPSKTDPCITSSAWILFWIYYQHQMPSSQSLLYVLQPTVVDKQQIGRGKNNRRKRIGVFVKIVYLLDSF